ncbi:MAG: hypothetical protein U9N35_00895, partial [Euryarchaeota archaeon]|nr:hypothetical protein [Euryarchaeota archaeon]
MRSKFSILKDFRVIILLAAIILSVVSISPGYKDGNFKTDVNLGLDFFGGSSIHLRMEGCIIDVRGTKEDILTAELGEGYKIANSGDKFVEFTAENLNATTVEELKELGYGTPSLKENTVRFSLSNEGAVVSYLEKMTDNEVILIEDKYEIRGPILDEKKGLTDEEIKEKPEEKLREYLRSVNAELVSYTMGVTPYTTKLTKDIISEKLNYAGLKDIDVRIWGEDYILVDLAGMPLEEARNYVAEPGKFEIKIYINETETARICTGTSISEISSVRKDSMTGAYGVPFELTEEGANKFSEATIEYGAVDNPEAHPIAMCLDNKEVFKAPLNTSLASLIKTGAWNGGGLRASLGGGDQETLERARALESHLRAGSLPVKPIIVNEGYIDPSLGEKFLKGVFSAIILAILAVAAIIYIRYREIKIVIPLLITGFSETLIVLGVITQIQQLDLPSIGGLIA